MTVGRSREMPLLTMVSIWKTFRSMHDGCCRESGRSSEARCREVPLYTTSSDRNTETYAYCEALHHCIKVSHTGSDILQAKSQE